MIRWGIICSLFVAASSAQAAESLTASFHLPIDKKSFTALSSAEVEQYSAETGRPFIRSEGTNLDLLFLQMTKSPESEWRDSALELVLTNNRHVNPIVSARLCPRGIGLSEACRALEKSEPRQHHQVSQGKLVTLGALQVELPNAAHVCLGSTANQCEVRLPVYAVQRLLKGQDLQLPRVLTAAISKSQVMLFDAERGLHFLSLFQFPDTMTLTSLGQIKSFSAVHRGLIRMVFANGLLQIDPLADRALLIGQGAGIYTASLGSHHTAWQKLVPPMTSTQSQACSGDALDLTESWALFSDCALPLMNGFPVADSLPVLLDESLKSARLKKGGLLQFLSWKVNGTDVVMDEFSRASNVTKKLHSQTLQFRGSSPSELIPFGSTLMRRTAWGMYRMGSDSEEKSSLPFSSVLPVVSRNGTSVAVKKDDKELGCRWYHLTATQAGFLNWKESGWQFKCHAHLFVTSAENSVAVTQWKAGTVTVNILSP